jgi:hypothetical protein
MLKKSATMFALAGRTRQKLPSPREIQMMSKMIENRVKKDSDTPV